MKKIILSKIFILKITLLCIFSLSACAKVEETENITQEMKQSSTSLALSEDPEAEIFEDISSAQMQWQVNIYPDMPQPYIEVLKQYEQFMNADNQNLNDESVRAKFGSEWEYVYDELCIYMPSHGIDYNYALADLTGNGFPEMVIASGDRPYIIYNYSETSGIGMEFTTSYFDMTIYQNGIVEYVSAGMYSSTTYVQFQEDVDAWVVIDTIAVDLIEDAYYGGNWGSDGELDTEITEEEYLRIQEKYVTEPMEFEWIPLFLDPFPE